jgi:iron-sulfur cluster repair protein YtfE (RIC family)
MAIQIGAKPESSFKQPLGLLSDCHRRIERFLAQLISVTAQVQGRQLGEPQREALEVALRYFRKAAPLHTQDEEASLFPRLRAADSAEAQAALEALDSLEADHDVADIAHAEVDRLGQRWLEVGSLTAEETLHLMETLHTLQETYRRHIAVEDQIIFPMAGRALTPEQITAVGQEMATRRGVPYETLLDGSRCASRRGL